MLEGYDRAVRKHRLEGARDGIDAWFARQRTAVEVRHPRLVPVLDVWWEPSFTTSDYGERIDTAIMWVVTATPPGEPLARRAGERFAPDAAAALIGHVAGALTACQTRGLYHRHVVPALVHLDGDRARLDAFVDDEPAHVPGVPQAFPADRLVWAAPEIARDGSPATARTTVYDLGCLLHLLLTGAPPFAGTLAERLVPHATAPPPTQAALAAAMPERLAAAIACALQKDPAARPATPREFAAAVAR
jgi:serine/threonine protein kinase